MFELLYFETTSNRAEGDDSFFFAFAFSFDTSSADVTPRVIGTAQAISDFIKILHQKFRVVYRDEQLNSSAARGGESDR